jgi:chromosome segregation ATPase
MREINYSSREKDVLLRIMSNGEHLATIHKAQGQANVLCRELQELYGELERCLNALENGIRDCERQIAEAERAAAQAAQDAARASTDLQNTPSTKTVEPSPEEAAQGAKPKTVPINQDKIASLEAEICHCNAEADRQAQHAKSLQEKLGVLKTDADTLMDGLSRVEQYLKTVEEALMRLETAEREARDECADRVEPTIRQLAEWMEQYADVEVRLLSVPSASHIRQKEIG